MSTTNFSATTPDATDSARSNARARRETLVGLIEAASAALDSDRDTARACIAKAAAMLKRSTARNPWREDSPEIQRGGLAPCQARPAPPPRTPHPPPPPPPTHPPAAPP